MKYDGTKAFQLYREDSPIKATLLFESNVEDELRTFLSSRTDLGGSIFRYFEQKTGSFIVGKIKATGRPPKPANARRLAFRR